MPSCNRNFKRLFLDGIEAPCDLVDCSLIVRIEGNQKWFELEFFRLLLLTLWWAAVLNYFGAFDTILALLLKRLHSKLKKLGSG